MKNPIEVFSLLLIAFLFSCQSSDSGKFETTPKETPEALQENKLDIKSYSREGTNLVEELYLELVETKPELKKVEQDLIDFRKKQQELNEDFSKYDNKSNRYYGSAQYKAEAIKDSTIRTAMVELINSSREKYKDKTGQLTGLRELISDNHASLNDQHQVLKIVLTLPLIEEFQDESMPDKKQFKDFADEQEKVLKDMQSIK